MRAFPRSDLKILLLMQRGGSMRAYRPRRFRFLVAFLSGLAAASSFCVLARAETWRLTVKRRENERTTRPSSSRLLQAWPPVITGSHCPVRAEPTGASVFTDGGKQWLAVILPRAITHHTSDLQPAPDAAKLSEHEISLTPSWPQHQDLDRPLALLRVPHGRRSQALLVPAHRSDRGVLHPGLPDGENPGRGLRPSPPALLLVHPWQGERNRFLVRTRESWSDQGNRAHDGAFGPGTWTAAHDR